MGTRHLIAVQKDGRYGIAQYGQWDGYPSGQGVGVLAFCQKMDRAAFGRKVAATKFIDFTDQAEVDRINNTPNWNTKWPWLSRDAGSDILDFVNDEPEGIQIKNSINFAGDSLFCEYAYVIDLDAGTLEVFTGFNKDALDESERFAKSPLDHAEYKQVKFFKSWPLDALPTEKEFLAELRDSDDDE